MLRRMAAFTAYPARRNPAGVRSGEGLPPQGERQRIAREIDYSETAFVAPASGACRTVRFYSSWAEVSFGGHTTIASGVVLGELGLEELREIHRQAERE
jgi:PhzF family phenazine biosynthesis protein